MLAGRCVEIREIGASYVAYETIGEQVPYGQRKEQPVYEFAGSLQVLLQAVCTNFNDDDSNAVRAKTERAVETLSGGMLLGFVGVRCAVFMLYSTLIPPPICPHSGASRPGLAGSGTGAASEPYRGKTRVILFRLFLQRRTVFQIAERSSNAINGCKAFCLKKRYIS